MVGRILRRLKERGECSRSRPGAVSSAHRRQWRRSYAVRKPKEYRATQPGELVEAHTRATATTAAGFLISLQKRMPFPIKALQVDGGSQFQASFEEACKERGTSLFVLPPRSPKLNGHVERAQRTHTESA